MIEALDVPLEQSTTALELIRRNLAWRNSDAGKEIKDWIEGSSATEAPTTNEPSESTSVTAESTPTDSTTLAGNEIFPSTVLALACAIMRLLL